MWALTAELMRARWPERKIAGQEVGGVEGGGGGWTKATKHKNEHNENGKLILLGNGGVEQNVKMEVELSLRRGLVLPRDRDDEAMMERTHV